jgi:hypothetical protein
LSEINLFNEIYFSFIGYYCRPLSRLLGSEPGKAAYIAQASKNTRRVFLDDPFLSSMVHAEFLELMQSAAVIDLSAAA